VGEIDGTVPVLKEKAREKSEQKEKDTMCPCIPRMGEALHNLQEIESGIIYEGRLFEDELQKQVRRRKK